MSDKMRPVEYGVLLEQILIEYRQKQTLFGVPAEKAEPFLPGVRLGQNVVESPVGPAAGPHTQLAQNIIAAYAGGARYFELKTVQVLDGAQLGIQKPCIYVNDEAYNTEWSTELTSDQALEEYIKAWFLLKIIAKEFGLGDESGFVFNMSVGYTLEGIQSDKIDRFIDRMKEAAQTPVFLACQADTIEQLPKFTKVTKDYVEKIESKVSDTITLSTMHGCPVEEIEQIATYLLEVKQLNLFIKCNPTLLGYEKARSILDTMGYSYVTFDPALFDKDLSFDRAVQLITQVASIARKQHKEFGVKLTNTFPVKIQNQELAGTDMYMSGTPLYPLALGVAAKLSEAFQGALRISYSGGADKNNIGDLYETGIYPITVSTLLLKPGGYKNLTKLNRALVGRETQTKGHINQEKINQLAGQAVLDKRYYKPSDKHHKINQNQAYSVYCSACKNCVDVCPNRANVRIQEEDHNYTIHMDALCNECGNCAHFCVLGHLPYKEKFTIFQTEADFKASENCGICKLGEDELMRWNGETSIPAPLRKRLMNL